MPETLPSTAPDPAAIETKLTAARTRLILDKPFLGALVLRLPLRAATGDWCRTTATDARAFYYNPAYIDALSLEQTQFMLAHEALHCALSHFARRGHRQRRRWDLACDYAINPLLIADGLTPPPNALAMPLYKGLTAEEIYPLIDEQDDSETLDTHAYDRDERQGGRQQRPDETPQRPESLSADERERLAVQWRQRLAGAAQQALQAGKLGGELARQIDHLLQPSLPWRMLLARHLTAIAREDYSYQRPSRREGDFILPGLRGQQAELVVAIDTSGSIQDGELSAFIGEIDALKGQIRARLTLLPCDRALAPGAPFQFEPWETFARPERLQGGGGTSFRPVFDWIERQDRQPDLLVYFTDAQGEFPEREPSYPVVWLVKGRAPVPWGQRIQLN
jgi:predicted metal-dependent peptidase